MNISAGDLRVRVSLYSPRQYNNMMTGPAGPVVEHPLRDWEVVGSSPGRAIPKALKMVPMATLLSAQHYKASIGFSSPNKYHNNIGTLTKSLKKSDNNQCLYSPEDRMEEWP